MAVTKEVWGKNTNVGAKKADMIASMRAQGYVLVNEIAEPYYFEGVAGFGAGNGTKYTLTFQYDEALHKQIQQEEEERKKREAEEAARRAKEEAERLERELQIELAKEKEEKLLRDPLGTGYGLLVTVNTEDKRAVKAAIKSIQSILTEPPLGGIFGANSRKKNFKKDQIILKKFGRYFALIDYGKDTCDLFARMLLRMGAQAESVMLDENTLIKYMQDMTAALRKRGMKKLRWDVDKRGILNDLIRSLIFWTVRERFNGSDKDFMLESYRYIISNK